jgi:hypothetical protein
LNYFQDYKQIQKIALGFVAVCLGLWILCGFDSNPLQLIHVLYDGIPGVITGSKNWGDLAQIYNYYYGKEMHYSAFVIYVMLYWFLSKNFEKIGIKKSENMIYSFGITFLSIAFFEYFWMVSFAFFQNQYWVITWQFPQERILIQDTFMFMIPGVLVSLEVFIRSFSFGDSVIVNGKKMVEYSRRYVFDAKNWKLWALFSAGIISAVFWIYYPFSTQQFSVTLLNGSIWHSSKLFPQTLYTIKMNPGSSDNSGVWFYIQNDTVHATNTIVKTIWAFTLYYLFKVKRPDEK